MLWIEPGGCHDVLFTLQKLKEIRRLSFFKDFNPLCNTAGKTFLIPSIKISTAAATSDSSILPSSEKKKTWKVISFKKYHRCYYYADSALTAHSKRWMKLFFALLQKTFCWTLRRKKRQLPNLKCNFPIVASYVLHFFSRKGIDFLSIFQVIFLSMKELRVVLPLAAVFFSVRSIIRPFA